MGTSAEEQQFYKNLKKGQRFQDYYSLVLWHERKKVLCNFQSHDVQKLIGENLQKEEIKYDEVSMDSKNIFIETKERVCGHHNLKPAGIYAQDNPKTYVVGNYDVIWTFNIETLQKFHKTNKPEEKPVENKKTGVVTAKGFVLSKKKADELCYDKMANLSRRWRQFFPTHIAEKLLQTQT